MIKERWRSEKALAEANFVIQGGQKLGFPGVP